MRHRILLLAAASAGIGTLVAAEATGQEVTAEAKAPTPVAQADLAWVEIIPGVDFAAVRGQWTEGAHAKFVRFAPGVAIPMHRHTNAYHGVVVRGELTNPYSGQEAVVMRVGDYWHVPGGVAHSNECLSDEPCVFFTYGDALWDVEIVED